MGDELPSYLTVGLHGISESIIIVTLPKYVVDERTIDTSMLEADGYGFLVNFVGDFEECFIAPLQKGDDIKVEIFSLSRFLPTTTTMKPIRKVGEEKDIE